MSFLSTIWSTLGANPLFIGGAGTLAFGSAM